MRFRVRPAEGSRVPWRHSSAAGRQHFLGRRRSIPRLTTSRRPGISPVRAAIIIRVVAGCTHQSRTTRRLLGFRRVAPCGACCDRAGALHVAGRALQHDLLSQEAWVGVRCSLHVAGRALQHGLRTQRLNRPGFCGGSSVHDDLPSVDVPESQLIRPRKTRGRPPYRGDRSTEGSTTNWI